MMKLIIFVMINIWLLVCSISVQAQTKPCGCADKKDLLNRLNIAEAAIQEYRVQIEVMKGQEKVDGKPLMLTQDRYLNMEERINEAMKNVKDLSANLAKAKSNGGNCELEEITAPTDCLRESILRHEHVHHTVCLAVKDSLGINETYQTRMRLIDFAQEEIFAYLEEKKFILSQLQSLPPSCRPNNWFGYVVYRKTKNLKTTRNILPKNTSYKTPSAGVSIIEGGNETQTSVDSYIGMLLVEEGKVSSARGFGSWKLDNNKTVNGRIYCYPRKPDVSTTLESGINSYGEGEQTGKPDFSLSLYPADGEYSIYILFFTVNIKGQTNVHSSRSGGCYAESPINTSTPLSLSESADKYSVKGKIERNFSDYLTGIKTELPPLLQASKTEGNISMLATYEIQVRWMLRRLPGK